jgi:hypothetical protein
LTIEQVVAIEKELKSFIAEWAAHGNSLYGDACMMHNRFLVIAVDESKVPASGCSIDSSTRFVKALGEKFGINFFDRMQLVVVKDDSFESCHLSDIKEYEDYHVFNPMITTLHDLNVNWLVPVKDSPFY